MSCDLRDPRSPAGIEPKTQAVEAWSRGQWLRLLISVQGGAGLIPGS